MDMIQVRVLVIAIQRPRSVHRINMDAIFAMLSRRRKRRNANTDMIRVHVRAIVIQQQRSVHRINTGAISVMLKRNRAVPTMLIVMMENFVMALKHAGMTEHV